MKVKDSNKLIFWGLQGVFGDLTSLGVPLALLPLLLWVLMIIMMKKVFMSLITLIIKIWNTPLQHFLSLIFKMSHQWMKGDLGTVSLEAEGCLYTGRGQACVACICSFPQCYGNTVSLGLEKWLSVILWMCASSGHRLPKQTSSIRFLSTSHRRVALLRMTSRMVRKDAFTHHCLCPPQILKPLAWTLQGMQTISKGMFL